MDKANRKTVFSRDFFIILSSMQNQDLRLLRFDGFLALALIEKQCFSKGNHLVGGLGNERC
jgi:hypothetical protein